MPKDIAHSIRSDLEIDGNSAWMVCVASGRPLGFLGWISGWSLVILIDLRGGLEFEPGGILAVLSVLPNKKSRPI